MWKRRWIVWKSRETKFTPVAKSTSRRKKRRRRRWWWRREKLFFSLFYFLDCLRIVVLLLRATRWIASGGSKLFFCFWCMLFGIIFWLLLPSLRCFFLLLCWFCLKFLCCVRLIIFDTVCGCAPARPTEVEAMKEANQHKNNPNTK